MSVSITSRDSYITIFRKSALQCFFIWDLSSRYFPCNDRSWAMFFRTFRTLFPDSVLGNASMIWKGNQCKVHNYKKNECTEVGNIAYLVIQYRKQANQILSGITSMHCNECWCVAFQNMHVQSGLQIPYIGEKWGSQYIVAATATKDFPNASCSRTFMD